jgi:hypothetical protein
MEFAYNNNYQTTIDIAPFEGYIDKNVSRYCIGEDLGQNSGETSDIEGMQDKVR